VPPRSAASSAGSARRRTGRSISVEAGSVKPAERQDLLQERQTSQVRSQMETEETRRQQLRALHVELAQAERPALRERPPDAGLQRQEQPRRDVALDLGAAATNRPTVARVEADGLAARGELARADAAARQLGCV